MGVNNYESLGLQLMFPSADAQAMAEAFQASSSLPSDVLTLIDSSATREHVLSRMADVSQQAQPDDQVWLYFAGRVSATEVGQGSLATSH
jgi:Caspase domain